MLRVKHILSPNARKIVFSIGHYFWQTLYEITLFVAWMSALSGPTRWRYFLPMTLVAAPCAIKDTLAGILRSNRSERKRWRRIKTSQGFLLLSQASSALAQFLALIPGLPIFGGLFIALGSVSEPVSDWTSYLMAALLLPVWLLVGWPMALGVMILAGIAVGLTMALIAVTVRAIIDLL